MGCIRFSLGHWLPICIKMNNKLSICISMSTADHSVSHPHFLKRFCRLQMDWNWSLTGRDGPHFTWRSVAGVVNCEHIAVVVGRGLQVCHHCGRVGIGFVEHHPGVMRAHHQVIVVRRGYFSPLHHDWSTWHCLAKYDLRGVGHYGKREQGRKHCLRCCTAALCHNLSPRGVNSKWCLNCLYLWMHHMYSYISHDRTERLSESLYNQFLVSNPWHPSLSWTLAGSPQPVQYVYHFCSEGPKNSLMPQ